MAAESLYHDIDNLELHVRPFGYSFTSPSSARVSCVGAC